MLPAETSSDEPSLCRDDASQPCEVWGARRPGAGSVPSRDAMGQDVNCTLRRRWLSFTYCKNKRVGVSGWVPGVSGLRAHCCSGSDFRKES